MNDALTSFDVKFSWIGNVWPADLSVQTDLWKKLAKQWAGLCSRPLNLTRGDSLNVIPCSDLVAVLGLAARHSHTAENIHRKQRQKKSKKTERGIANNCNQGRKKCNRMAVHGNCLKPVRCTQKPARCSTWLYTESCAMPAGTLSNRQAHRKRVMKHGLTVNSHATADYRGEMMGASPFKTKHNTGKKQTPGRRKHQEVLTRSMQLHEVDGKKLCRLGLDSHALVVPAMAARPYKCWYAQLFLQAVSPLTPMPRSRLGLGIASSLVEMNGNAGRVHLVQRHRYGKPS